MPDLFDTFFPDPVDPEDPLAFPRTMDISTFYFGIVDYVSGNTTRAQIISFLSLDSEQTAQLDILLATVDGITTIAGKVRWLLEFQAALHLAAFGIKYTTKADFAARLGL